MGSINLEPTLQVITILGGAIALFLAVLQIVETYLDIGEKLQKRRQARKGIDRAWSSGVNPAVSYDPGCTATETAPAQLPRE